MVVKDEFVMTKAINPRPPAMRSSVRRSGVSRMNRLKVFQRLQSYRLHCLEVLLLSFVAFEKFPATIFQIHF